MQRVVPALFANEASRPTWELYTLNHQLPSAPLENIAPAFYPCLNNGCKRTRVPFEQGVRKTTRVQTTNGTCLPKAVNFWRRKCFPNGEM